MNLLRSFILLSSISGLSNIYSEGILNRDISNCLNVPPTCCIPNCTPCVNPCFVAGLVIVSSTSVSQVGNNFVASVISTSDTTVTVLVTYNSPFCNDVSTTFLGTVLDDILITSNRQFAVFSAPAGSVIAFQTVPVDII